MFTRARADIYVSQGDIVQIIERCVAAEDTRARELSLQVQRQALETRQAELFINIYNRWTDPEFAKHYHAVR